MPRRSRATPEPADADETASDTTSPSFSRNYCFPLEALSFTMRTTSNCTAASALITLKYRRFWSVVSCLFFFFLVAGLCVLLSVSKEVNLFLTGRNKCNFNESCAMLDLDFERHWRENFSAQCIGSSEDVPWTQRCCFVMCPFALKLHVDFFFFLATFRNLQTWNHKPLNGVERQVCHFLSFLLTFFLSLKNHCKPHHQPPSD